jgi:hypothetical protein
MTALATKGSVRAALLALGVGLIAAGASIRAADADSPVIPDIEYPKIVKYAVKNMQDALKGAPKDDAVQKARVAAAFLAAAAQDNLTGTEGAQRAGTRDAALKVFDLIKEKKYTEAGKLVPDLAAVPADANAKKEKVKLMDDKLSMADLMSQFDDNLKKGYGVHGKLYNLRLVYKGKLPDKELNDSLLLAAYQVAITAELANAHKPEKKAEDWLKYTADLKTGGEELAKAVKNKDGTAGLAAVQTILTNCKNCHDKIRDK